MTFLITIKFEFKYSSIESYGIKVQRNIDTGRNQLAKEFDQISSEMQQLVNVSLEGVDDPTAGAGAPSISKGIESIRHKLSTETDEAKSKELGANLAKLKEGSQTLEEIKPK